ncbi:hypothetical protein CC80DRAFT_468705 [Byssothecium circinans]|uniref:Uncharacterized protein n=1 Tax=Byssothecium circinans TaxID=147558 RepID=A0A6A5UCQ1_9PLEO|nr:hypothetical protein CC80DRAFT_468705 [Byssothecium circinans]
MLARFHTRTARTVHTAIARPFYAPRPFLGRPCCVATRACHTATAEFTNLGPDGKLVTKEVSIQVGDPGEAYVLIPTEVGYALQAGSYLTNSSSALPKRPDRFALSYFHDTQHFALDSSPGCPRLVIPQQLPHQSAANTSLATLYHYGLMHTIALDGTRDAKFAELASTIIPEIRGALDKLKDM